MRELRFPMVSEDISPSSRSTADPLTETLPSEEIVGSINLVRRVFLRDAMHRVAESAVRELSISNSVIVCCFCGA